MDNEIMNIYRSNPMDDGDVVVLLEEFHVATEIEGLANHWDDELCRNLASVVRELKASELEIGVARQQAVLRESDHQLLVDLRAALADSGITIHPLIALPAARSVSFG